MNLKESLSISLNRPISDNFIASLQAYISKNPDLEKFRKYCEILGINEGISTDIFNSLVVAKEAPVPSTTKDVPSTTKDVPSNLSSSINSTTKVTSSGSKVESSKKKLINYEDDDIDELIIKKPKTIKFKKMKKEDALKFRYSEVEELSLEESTVPFGAVSQTNKSPNQYKGPDIESKKSIIQSTLSPTPSTSSPTLSNTSVETYDNSLSTYLDINDDLNDREWYIDDYEEPIEEPTKPFIPKAKPKPRSGGTGGYFNEFGEYVDLDHNESNKSQIISITSHFFIPPFLEKDKQNLSIQIGKKTGVLKINSFDPIKDHNTHLAIISKQGSPILNERRSKKERAKQAKERSEIAGTNLGNVLGVKTEIKEKSVKQKPQELVSNKLDITNQRRSLPAYSVKDELMKMINENQVTVVIGETGSGKTTQLTQYLYDNNYGQNLASNGTRKIIGCTQPRRVAAMSVAKRVSEEMGCKLGDEVGYTIRFEDKTKPDKTIIKYMTDGILLRELLLDSNLDNYSCIIMDEAHERSLNTDILLGLLRILITKRKDLKLIITSATINADFFSDFFGGAPQFTIPGRTFPVEVFYNRTAQDYVESAVKLVVTLHLDNINSQGESDGDILVFMTGQEDIEATCELIQEQLDELNMENIPPLEILPIYSTLPSEMQSKIFNKSDKYKRKCVVATNIAETSLTVDGVKYVIDCGLIKLKIYNPKLGMDMLSTIPISLANGNQRTGRAGRTGPGKCYRLFSETEFTSDKLNIMPIPEIKRTNLSNVMLLLKSLKVADLNEFPFIDTPPNELLSCSLYDLWCLGALNNMGQLTDLGFNMINFPMEPSLSKLIIVSTFAEFKCSIEILTIVSMLSVPSVYYRPKERMDEADMTREKFAIENSDHLTLLNIYNQWESQLRSGKSPQYLNNWCSKNFLNSKSLIRAKDIRNQLCLIMKNKKLPLLSNKNDETIKKCLCYTFFQQSARLSKINLVNSNQIEYINLRHSFMKLYLHPTSVLNNSRDLPPEYVIYHELILTKKEYMNCVTSVDPLWLLEYGYMFYDVSEKDRLKLGLPRLKEEFQKTLENDMVEFNEQKQKKSVGRVSKQRKVFKPRGI